MKTTDNDRVVVVVGPSNPDIDRTLRALDLAPVRHESGYATVWLPVAEAVPEVRSPAGDRGAPAIPAPLLVTIAEAAKVLGVGRSTLYELIARRELEVIHIGRAARIPATALDGLVSRLRQQSLTGADVTVGPPR